MESSVLVGPGGRCLGVCGKSSFGTLSDYPWVPERQKFSCITLPSSGRVNLLSTTLLVGPTRSKRLCRTSVYVWVSARRWVGPVRGNREVAGTVSGVSPRYPRDHRQGDNPGRRHGPGHDTWHPCRHCTVSGRVTPRSLNTYRGVFVCWGHVVPLPTLSLLPPGPPCVESGAGPCVRSGVQGPWSRTEVPFTRNSTKDVPVGFTSLGLHLPQGVLWCRDYHTSHVGSVGSDYRGCFCPYTRSVLRDVPSVSVRPRRPRFRVRSPSVSPVTVVQCPGFPVGFLTPGRKPLRTRGTLFGEIGNLLC